MIYNPRETLKTVWQASRRGLTDTNPASSNLIRVPRLERAVQVRMHRQPVSKEYRYLDTNQSMLTSPLMYGLQSGQEVPSVKHRYQLVRLTPVPLPCAHFPAQAHGKIRDSLHRPVRSSRLL